ncbi:MAG: dTDP-glucose 4,6-dehydratase [Clostridia bacterium]|nr:dTDP-glucose 4,6-dehydratase [Clostridia bacterium]
MTLLITGGCGFIGSAFLLGHIEAFPHDRVVCLDKMTYAAIKNIPDIVGAMSENFRFVKGDIADRECVFRLFEEERPDAVVNFAAETHVDRSINDPQDFVRSNFVGVSVLLDACVKYSVKRFHQISTDEVYGEYFSSSDEGFDEEARLLPSSPYSATKASADMLALSYARTYKLFVTVSRSANTYGPRQNPEKLIPKTITNLLTGKKVPVMGNGLNRRDWLYVTDHCKAVEAILKYGQPGEIYNVSGEREEYNIDIVRKLISLLGKDESCIEFVPERAGHDDRYLVDSKKLESLGWKHEIPLEKGILDTVKWYLENYKTLI